MLILSPKNIVSPFIESAFAPLSLWFSGSLCQYAYRQPYLTPRHSLEKPALGGSLRNRVEGSILLAHARDLQQKRPGTHQTMVRSGPFFAAISARGPKEWDILELLRSNKQAFRFSENEWLTDEKAICQSAAYSSWLHHIPAPSHSTGWESMSHNKSWVALGGALTKSGVIAELERSKTSTLSFFRDIFQQPSHYLFYYIMCNFFTLSFNSLRLPTSSSNGTDSP